MTNRNYIYSFKYDIHNRELCKLESRQLFGEEEDDNLLFSFIDFDPSVSPFIKSRFEIVLSSNDYSDLLAKIENEKIHIDGFKAEYLLLKGDTTAYRDRLVKLKDIGYCIDGDPDYVTPNKIYSICKYKDVWYFGILIKHDTSWLKHKQKPNSFSSSINIDIAKALVNIASKGDISNRLLDACCGVGTIMLEACIAGFNIEGCDINWKACRDTRQNLAHFNYDAQVYRTDIKDLDKKYDTAIIDLPYNLYCVSDEATTLNIIESTAKLCTRIVIVSTSDIEGIITNKGLTISDRCTVEKKGKKFKRKIWVCEKR